MSAKRVPLNQAIEQDFLTGNSDLKPHSSAANVLDGLPSKEVKERTVRITVDLPESIHRRLKQYCLDKKTSIIEVIIYLLDKLLPK